MEYSIFDNGQSHSLHETIWLAAGVVGLDSLEHYLFMGHDLPWAYRLALRECEQKNSINEVLLDLALRDIA